MLFFYFAGFIVLVVLLYVTLKGFSRNSDIDQQGRLKLHTMEEYILPNNRGWPIERVIRSLDQSGVIPEFHIIVNEDNTTEDCVDE